MEELLNVDFFCLITINIVIHIFEMFFNLLLCRPFTFHLWHFFRISPLAVYFYVDVINRRYEFTFFVLISVLLIFVVCGSLFLWHAVDLVQLIISRNFKLIWPYLCCWQHPYNISAGKSFTVAYRKNSGIKTRTHDTWKRSYFVEVEWFWWWMLWILLPHFPVEK